MLAEPDVDNGAGNGIWALSETSCDHEERGLDALHRDGFLMCPSGCRVLPTRLPGTVRAFAGRWILPGICWLLLSHLRDHRGNWRPGMLASSAHLQQFSR